MILKIWLIYNWINLNPFVKSITFQTILIYNSILLFITEKKLLDTENNNKLEFANKKEISFFNNQ